MSTCNSAAEDMLNIYLHSGVGVIDRLSQGDRRVFGSSNRSTQPSSTAQRNSDKKELEAAAIQKLEKEMDRITDPVLLLDAKTYQRELKQGTGSYVESAPQ